MYKMAACTHGGKHTRVSRAVWVRERVWVQGEQVRQGRPKGRYGREGAGGARWMAQWEVWPDLTTPKESQGLGM